MTMSQFEKVHYLLVNDVIHNKRERKAVKELVCFLHELFDNKLQKEEQLPEEFQITLMSYLKARRWKKHGYCEETSNSFNLRLTQKAIAVFEKLVEAFEQRVSDTVEYLKNQEKYAAALKEHISILQQFQKDLPRLIQEAVEKGMKEAKDFHSSIKSSD